MLIECTYGPVSTEVMGTVYTFTPDEFGRAVAEVWDRKHIDALTSVVHYRAVKKEPLPPTLTQIDPDTAVLGSEDITMRCTGSDFTEASVIYFAGQPEPIVFVSESEVTTVVKPSLGWGPVSVKVYVQDGGDKSDELTFTFTEPVEDEAEEGTGLRSGDKPDYTKPGDPIPVTEITGIGPAMAAKLSDKGITDARQIANLSDKDAIWLDNELALGGRIARDGWIEQAKNLVAEAAKGTTG